MNLSSFLVGLSSVFDPLLKSSVQAGLVIVVVLVLRALLGRRMSAGWLHALWLVVMIRMALPWLPQVAWSPFALLPSSRPAATAKAPLPLAEPWPEAQGTAVAPVAGDLTSTPVTEPAHTARAAVTTDLSAPPEQDAGWSLFHVAYVVWLAGIVGLGASVGLASVRLWRSVRFERLVTDQQVLDLMEDCRKVMRVHVPVGLIVSDRIASPALLGWVRPRLLLPGGILETLDLHQLRHVFLHELAHLRRHDVVFGWVMCILQILHWCNPLVWIAAGRMRADRELACDALAMSTLGEEGPRVYGNTILRLLERFSSQRNLPALTGILEDKRELKRRVAMIARYNPRAQRTSLAGLAVILVVGGFALTDAPSQTTGVARPENAAEEAPARTEPFSPDTVYTIVPGRGLDIIQVGATRDQVEKLFGKPESTNGERGVYRLVYHRRAGMDFLLSEEDDRVVEIRFNTGFKGKTTQGIAIGTPLGTVLARHGGARQTVSVRRGEKMFEGHVLYQQTGEDNRVSAYKFIDNEHGVLYWCDEGKQVFQIVVFAPQSLKIVPGKGLENLGVGDTAERIEKVFGQPSQRRELGASYKLSYDKASVDFIMDRKSDRIKEIHFNRGFAGKLDQGIGLGSTLEQIIAKTGPVKKRANASPEEAQSMRMGSDRVLYTTRMGREVTGYKLADSAAGINYWFDADKRLVQVVVYAAKGHSDDRANPLPEGSRIDEHGHIVDRTDWPFVNDPAVLGKWESVDFVKEIKDFDPAQPSGRKLFIKGMVFEEDGKANYGFLKWTQGRIIHMPNKTAAEYTIKELSGRTYMFMEWKSGDYTIRHHKPSYYVLTKLPADSPKLANPRELYDMDMEMPKAELGPDSRIDEQGHVVDKVDYPFVIDPDVLGTWKSVDFVREKESFDPAQPTWSGDLFLKEMRFLPRGRMQPQGHWTWTKGLVLNKRRKTASQYVFQQIEGETYMFFEWKSGDYKVLHRKPSYYVLKKSVEKQP